MSNRAQTIKEYIKSKIKATSALYTFIENDESRIFLDSDGIDTFPQLPCYYITTSEPEKRALNLAFEPVWSYVSLFVVTFVTSKIEQGQNDLQEVDKELFKLFRNDWFLGDNPNVLWSRCERSSFGIGSLTGQSGDVAMSLTFPIRVSYFADD